MIKPYIEISYGELLRLFRKKNRLTIKAVAEKLNVTTETIKNYENNHTLPRLGKIIELEKLYGSRFEKLSVYLRSEKREKIKKNAEPLILRLESPPYVFKLHGSFSDLTGRFRNPRKSPFKTR